MATSENDMATGRGGAGTSAPGGVSAAAATAAGTRVRMEKVTKSFGDNVVLDELDLDIDPAEKLVVIGPSGSGKTTILRVLMTLEPIDSGHIRLDDDYLYHVERDGQLVRAGEKHIRTVRNRVGMVFQHFHLFPHKTVQENITLGPIQAQGVSKDEANQRADELLEAVGLAGRGHSYPSQLSGGQKQRVAIARALAMQPDVMLFDEVTSALDPELVGEVLNVLRDLAKQSSMTLIIVTHEMRFAQEIADRVVMFDEGKVVEQGPPAQIFSEPTEQRTRDFLHAVLEA